MGNSLRLQAMTTAAGLGSGERIDWWSLVICGLALAALLWPAAAPSPWSTAWLLSSVLTSCVQRYLAIRVALDAKLFRELGRTWSNTDPRWDNGDAHDDLLIELDQALAAAGLRKFPQGDRRDFSSRQRGAWRLLRIQTGALAVQLATLVAAIPALRLH